ncbi:MAG: hypothetical protein IKP31_07200 [Lachnospiraceae bacterium]|nr:hypothetical protein [Lachnospiraceae bacterium]
MGIISNSVSKDSVRIKYMIGRYREIKKSLPKGTICPKQIGHQTYYYLKYRDGERIVSDYIHKEDLENLTELIEHRKHAELMIRSLNNELKTAKKLLRSR